MKTRADVEANRYKRDLENESRLLFQSYKSRQKTKLRIPEAGMSVKIKIQKWSFMY